MAEYHVGCGAFAIYAGTLKKNPSKAAREHGLKEWQSKSEVTDEAVSAVAQLLLQRDEQFRFEYRGREYVMRVSEKGQ